MVVVTAIIRAIKGNRATEMVIKGGMDIKAAETKDTTTVIKGTTIAIRDMVVAIKDIVLRPRHSTSRATTIMVMEAAGTGIGEEAIRMDIEEAVEAHLVIKSPSLHVRLFVRL